MPRRGRPWARRPSEIPIEEMEDMIRRMCQVMESAGKNGIDQVNLCKIVNETGNQASVYGLAIISLRTQGYVMGVMRGDNTRLYLTRKYYQAKAGLEEE